MIEKTVKVESGLDTRPIALFVQLANTFSSKIQVKSEDILVNAKSIMGIILSLGNLNDEIVTIIADGADEDKAVFELTKFLAANH